MQSISLLQMQTEQAVLEDYSLKTIEQPSVLLGQCDIAYELSSNVCTLLWTCDMEIKYSIFTCFQ